VQELQKDNSAQQAKMLMSALGGGGSGLGESSGLGSLLGSSASATSASPGDSGSSERTTQLEREVSTLTNDNLKLQD